MLASRQLNIFNCSVAVSFSDPVVSPAAGGWDPPLTTACDFTGRKASTMSTTPRRTPGNPFAKPDLAAETAICSAFVVLDFRGETPGECRLRSTATQILSQQLGPSSKGDVVDARIKAAWRALYDRNALDVPKDIFKACVLHGEDLHPDLRAHLGLPTLPSPPPPAPPPVPAWELSFSPFS